MTPHKCTVSDLLQKRKYRNKGIQVTETILNMPSSIVTYNREHKLLDLIKQQTNDTRKKNKCMAYILNKLIHFLKRLVSLLYIINTILQCTNLQCVTLSFDTIQSVTGFSPLEDLHFSFRSQTYNDVQRFHLYVSLHLV